MPIDYVFPTCNCMTKTPEPTYHRKSCPVWMDWRLGQIDSERDSFVVHPQTTAAEVNEIIDTLKHAVKYAP